MLAAVDISQGQVSTADGMSAATSRVMNLMADVAGVQNFRPGLVDYPTTGLGTAPLIGLYRWKTWLVGVDSDRHIYAMADVFPSAWSVIDAGTAITMLDGNLRPQFAEDASDLFIVGGGKIQKWTGVGTTTRVAAGPAASHIANIGQRLIANDLSNPTRYYYSNAGDGSDGTWGALDFITAEARPDPIVAIHENTAELFLFGGTTTEVHGISANPLVPYERIATQNLGMGAAYSAIRSDNIFHWLDNRSRFVMSDGRSYQWLSEAIHKDLLALSTTSDCRGFVEDTARGTYLVWIFPTAGRTFHYNTTSKKWGERDYYSAPSHVAWPVTCHAFWDAVKLNVVGSSTSASLYKLDTTVGTDISSTMVGEIITGHQDFGTQSRKSSSRIVVTMQRGAATASSQLEVAVADDGKGWSNFKTRTLGVPGDYRSQVEFRFGGIFRRRRYWIRYSGADPISLVSLHDDVNDLEAQANA